MTESCHRSRNGRCARLPRHEYDEVMPLTSATARVPHPLLLIILDGIADRPYPELQGRTPLEAASTPALDAFARDAANGFHYPLGPGRTPSSELVHFRLFGYDGFRFPGRAVLEALGHDLPLEPGDAVSYLAVRRVRVENGVIRITGGYGEDVADAAAIYADLAQWRDPASGYRFQVYDLHKKGEAILVIRQGDARRPPCGDVTDSDPFFFTDLPMLHVQARRDAADPVAAAETAAALNRFLRHAGRRLAASGRRLVSKWSGTMPVVPLPTFMERTGLVGMTIANAPVYRGFARLFGLRHQCGDRDETQDPEGDVRHKALLAQAAIEAGAGFVHLHTKAADEAAHAGDPHAKVAVIEALDRGLAPLLGALDPEWVVAVTADHATPVGGRSVHWGDSVPIAVRGPYARVDQVTEFGERAAVRGSLGQLHSRDILPYLLSQADRAHFLGATPAAFPLLGRPQRAEPFRDDG